MVLCWLWTNRKYVGIGVCLNLNVCVIAWYTMRHDTTTIAHLPAIKLYYNGNDTRMARPVLMFIMIECMELFRVGFGRTESTLVMVYV